MTSKQGREAPHREAMLKGCNNTRQNTIPYVRLHTERQHRQLHQQQEAQLTYSLGEKALLKTRLGKLWTIQLTH